MMEQFLRDSMTFVTPENEEEALSFIANSDWIVVDVETSGLNAWDRDRLCALGIGDDKRQYFFDLRTVAIDEKVWKALRHVPIIVGHNIKFDLSFLYQLEFDVSAAQQIHDTIVMGRLLTYERFPDLGLSDCICKVISASAVEYDRQFKELMKKNKYKTYDKAPSRELGIYCMNDVYYTAMLYEKFKTSVISRGLTNIWEHEVQVTKMTWQMEKTGVSIDLDYCKYAHELLTRKSDKIKLDIDKSAGREINLDSNKQLSEFFKSQKVKSPVKTPGGKESWSENALVAIDHPVAKKIKEYRSINKLDHTYFEDYTRRGALLHPSLKNWGTVTGRFACADPNIQNLPKIRIPIIEEDTDDSSDEIKTLVKDLIAARRGHENVAISGAASGSYGSWLSLMSKAFDETNEISVRRAIIPHPGKILLGFDFSQMELRVLFAYINNPFVDKYLDDREWDGHTWVAGIVWGKTPEDSNFKFYRGLAKAINFGIIYGSGDVLLAAQIQKTKEEAAQFRKDYYAKIPGFVDFMKKLRSTLLTRGYVYNRFGRRYSVTSDRLYVLVNYLVQGTSADIVKDRMVELNHYCETHTQYGVTQIMQVHDEIVLECNLQHETVTAVVADVQKILEAPVFRKSLPVDPTVYYPSYAHKLDYHKDDCKELIHVYS